MKKKLPTVNFQLKKNTEYIERSQLTGPLVCDFMEMETELLIIWPSLLQKHLLTEGMTCMHWEHVGTGSKVRSPRISSWLCNMDIKKITSLFPTTQSLVCKIRKAYEWEIVLKSFELLMKCDIIVIWDKYWKSALIKMMARSRTVICIW